MIIANKDEIVNFISDFVGPADEESCTEWDQWIPIPRIDGRSNYHNSHGSKNAADNR